MFPPRTGHAPSPGLAVKADSEGASPSIKDEVLSRYRIALLAFDTADALVLAAHDLIKNSFTASQVCIFGTRTAVSPLPPQADLFASLALCPADELPLTNASAVSFRCGPQAAMVFGLATHGLKSTTGVSPDWLRPDISSSIARSISEGRLVLLVAAQSANQHALGARLLLGHGKHDLQTHEFSVREPS